MANTTVDYSGTGPGTPPKVVDLSMGFTVDDLRRTHYIYKMYEDEWGFLQAAYDGAMELIAYGALFRHERESNENYKRRVDEAYGFSYSRSVVDLVNFYLFKEAVKRNLGKLADDDFWNKFTDDCNLDGDSLDEFLLEAGKASSVQGHIGVLVDKPNISLPTKQEEKDNNVYPYLSMYKPLAILDWSYDRDEYGRPVLIYLKLKDDEDDLYRVWTLNMWQIWAEPDPDASEGSVLGSSKAELIAEGVNPLGVIPWVWIYNGKTNKRGFGYSDITDISRIDGSIIRNLSQGEEIINYAAFPMLTRPWKLKGKQAMEEDEVGPTAVIGFDPEHPESKPSWLEAKVLEPISALFDKVIDRKIQEIYRSANIGGLQQTETSTSPKSGTALKSEFQLLNGKLVKKGKALERGEREIVWYWLLWQVMSDLFEEINIERAETYEVENLAEDLENILTSTVIVQSKEFFRRIQKKVARLMLPNADDDDIAEVDKDIDDTLDAELIYDENYTDQSISESIPGKKLDGEKQTDQTGKIIQMK